MSRLHPGIFRLFPGNQLIASGAHHRSAFARGGMASILVVDDNAEVRKVMTRGLEFAGHRVMAAADGWKAMIGFRRQGADLVIMDMSCSEPESHHTMTEIRSLNRDVKVLALSRAGRQSEGEFLGCAAACGADGFLTKPFSLLDLLVAVDELLPMSARSRLHEAS